MRGRPDGQDTGSRLDFDVIREPSNLQQRLGKPYPPRVTDFDQLRANHRDLMQARSHCRHTRARCAWPYGTRFTIGGAQLPLRIEGAVSLGQFMRSIGMKSSAGERNQLASLSLPGESFWK
jgi:hypothetical protein